MPRLRYSRSEPVLVSACLLGVPCRWNGRSARSARAIKLFETRTVIGVCPEILGGLPVPRPACEIIGGLGKDVIAGRALIRSKKGRDYTPQMIAGARRALALARRVGAHTAVLKEGSPSCGVRHIHSGKFDSKVRPGRGVFCELLVRDKISTTGIT